MSSTPVALAQPFNHPAALHHTGQLPGSFGQLGDLQRRQDH
jgi:hypothetical protein